MLYVYLAAHYVNNFPNLNDRLLFQFLHQHFDHELHLLLLVSCLPNKYVIKLYVGRYCKPTVDLQGLDQHSRQLVIFLSDDFVVTLVWLKVVYESSLFLCCEVHDAKFRPQLLLNLIKLLGEVSQLRIPLCFFGHLHLLRLIVSDLKILPEVFEFFVEVQNLEDLLNFSLLTFKHRLFGVFYVEIRIKRIVLTQEREG